MRILSRDIRLPVKEAIPMEDLGWADLVKYLLFWVMAKKEEEKILKTWIRIVFRNQLES